MERLKFTGFHDVNGKALYVGMRCFDQENNVSDIEITEKNGEFYASPEGLDSESLSAVYHGLRIISE